MVMYCDFCLKEHNDFHWKGRIEDGKSIHLCRRAFSSPPTDVIPMDLSKKGQRLSHWKEITSRVRTHEGELLSGNKGRTYQEKYGQKYLGITARPINFNSAAFQKELAKTK